MITGSEGRQLSTSQEIAVATVKASPPLAVAFTSAIGAIDWSTVAYIATTIYTAFMLYFLLRDKWWRDRKKKKRGA